MTIYTNQEGTIFDVKTINQLLGINDAYKATDALMNLLLDDEKKTAIFKNFLKISTDLSTDWFHEYFESEQAERKSKKQNFTPDSIAVLLNKLVSKTNGYYYEPAAGTGGILIKRWWQDCLMDPVHFQNRDNCNLSWLTYDPRSYWYQVEELSDRAIPFLIFNMAIRGMNGIVIQCNSLTRKANAAYFIKNDTDNFLNFSEIIEVPHTDDFAQYLHVDWK